jgi:Tfp pilus assembly protein PilF
MLGMFNEALAELQKISIEDKEASALRVEVLHAAQKWTRLRRFAARLVDHEPGEVGWWVSLAFATRRCVSIQEARKLLLRAEELHADEAIVQFNLGCYACQIGALEEARDRVRRSIAADPHFLEIARNDSDLAPLRETDPQFLLSE